MADLIERQAAIDAHCELCPDQEKCNRMDLCPDMEVFRLLPSAQLERTWYPVAEPPNHHKDVIVRGIEAIGNVAVHKIMQWDANTWRPTDYAPSIEWKEWSEI